MTEIALSRDLISRGYSPEELARMTRAGQLHRVRRGAYSPSAVADLDPRVAHLLLLEATTRQNSHDAVVSHMSAAALQGLDSWQAVAVGDAALRMQLDPDELAELLDRASRRHGIRRARRAAALLDGRAESPPGVAEPGDLSSERTAEA